MARQAANLTSIDVLATLKGALARFDREVSDALVALELESRRAVDWIEHDRRRYWPGEVQKASNALSEARIALERCELTIDVDDRRSCYDERKALERAKHRLRLAEEKVQAVQRWRVKLTKDVEEFQVQIAKLRGYLETDMVRATTVLARMADAVERYVQRKGPDNAESGAGRAIEPLASGQGSDGGKGAP